MIITGKKFSKPEMSRVINGDRVLEVEDEKPEKFRLDILLTERFPEYNRSTIQKFIKNGYVEVDGEVVKKANVKYEKIVNLSVNIPETPLLSDEMSPTVIYEDDNVKVVNKPSGLLSMTKGEPCSEPSLSDFGLLVHRLDRGTSGVVILAKNEKTQSMLRRQFQERKAHKVYYAIIHGRPKLDEAKIDLPIARNRNHPATFTIDPNGRESITFYKVIKSNDNYSLIELRPITGRTHQIRVHLKYIGTPIVGDCVYGNDNSESDGRLMLHAASLEITIPGLTPDSDNVRKTFEAPLPDEFEEYFKD